jgi:hypothetical protein
LGREQVQKRFGLDAIRARAELSAADPVAEFAALDEPEEGASQSGEPSE